MQKSIKKNILLLGSGRVVKPMVDYLMDELDYSVHILSLDIKSAHDILGPERELSGKGEANLWNADAEDWESKLREEVIWSDLVVSMIFREYHSKIIEVCIEQQKDFVSSDFLTPEIECLHERAVGAGITVLFEVGLDPGLDHLMMCKLVSEAHEEGMSINYAMDVGVAAPSPQSDTNPFRYKVSWCPSGMIDSSQVDCTLVEEGKPLFIEGSQALAHTRNIDLGGFGVWEAFPKGNVPKYINHYGLQEEKNLTFYRGIIRYPGFCPVWKVLMELGYGGSVVEDFTNLTYAQYMLQLLHNTDSNTDPKLALCRYLDCEISDPRIRKIEWLGLFMNNPIPFGIISPKFLLADLMEKKMSYVEGEHDMVFLYAKIIGEYADGRQEERVMTLYMEGDYPQLTALSLTVGVPVGVAVQTIFTHSLQKGVILPPKEVLDSTYHIMSDHNLNFKLQITPIN